MYDQVSAGSVMLVPQLSDEDDLQEPKIRSDGGGIPRLGFSIGCGVIQVQKGSKGR